ncbi:DNA polymerase III subunit alpha [Costertonia aggregata]|uniref:DNA-directed DNA polymerase n=1 Tax=Costertonia aggregata TaxID=343403 RepID=A0A7H9AT31_9FLAO|nr:DNA polymerase III subunit alpha [Costertonia aggregata]QLG46502.1 DNA polymerase III subunit alpha [Costertonia aggregata]
MYLNCHTYYSLRYGTFSEIELLKMAKTHGVYYLAVTDINSTTACLNFLKEAKNYDLHPAVGVDFRNGVEQLYVILAKTNMGFQEINTYLSKHLHEKKAFPIEAPELRDTYVVYPFQKILERKTVQLQVHEFIGISLSDLRKLPFSNYRHETKKLVIQQPVSFRNQSDFNAHRLLRTIDLNTLLSKLPTTEQGSISHRMIPITDLRTAYKDFPSLWENTERILSKCKVDFKFDYENENQNQAVYLEDRKADFQFLKKECLRKVRERFPRPTKELYARLDKELEAIRSMDFVSYFLINYDIIRYAKSKNYPYIGRGSGANSLVAYILGITNVDPIELDLYFERFINVYRSSPPDFDIDFGWNDREDITRYIFERFPNTALMGTYVTFQYRAVVRELGKVFGLPKEEIDAFLIGRRLKNPNPDTDEYLKLITKYGKLIHGFPNHLSVHAGGILITKKPISYYTATFMPPKGYQTVQFDMNIAESVGIHKFDILSQTGLPKIKHAIEIIKENQPNAEIKDVENYKQFTRDPNINNLLKTGDCIGVFYVESPAMRVLMTKLRTQDYLNLVAASSIIRPGVSNGGMKNEFILRHRNPERCKQAHPVMMEILHDTYGVMVYQEDVLKVAHKFAGLSLAEADILRRGMRGKVSSKGQFERIEQKFKDNCVKKGYSDQLIEEIWGQVKAFAGYAFAKGHSASYAVESYQSLYLKRYFPLEFMTAVLNNGGGFYNVQTYINEIKNCGGIVEPPCINNSDHPNCIKGKTVYLGFGMIKSLEDRTVQRLLSVRQTSGLFKSLDDFVDRVKISLEQLMLLVRLDAFRFTGLDKHQIAWQAQFKLKATKQDYHAPVLFRTQQKSYALPQFKTNALIDAYDQMELLGYPLVSRFDLLAEQMSSDCLAKDLPSHNKKRIVIYGDLVTAKGTATNDKRLMHFGTFLDKHGDVFDTVHFPNVSEKYPIIAKGIYKITGKVTEEMEYFSLNAEKVEFQTILPDPRQVDEGHKTSGQLADKFIGSPKIINS